MIMFLRGLVSFVCVAVWISGMVMASLGAIGLIVRMFFAPAPLEPVLMLIFVGNIFTVIAHFIAKHFGEGGVPAEYRDIE